MMGAMDELDAELAQIAPPTALQRHLYRLLLGAAVGLLALGTVVFRWLEGWSWVDSFYFCSVAVTTVGFGDLTPTTDAGKLFCVGYIFVGIAIITTFLDARLKMLGLRRVQRRSR